MNPNSSPEFAWAAFCVKNIFLLYSSSAKSYSSNNSSNSSLEPNIVSSRYWTDSDELTSGLLVVANDNVLKEPIAVGEPPSALVLM